MKVVVTLLLIYLIYRFIRNIAIFFHRSRRPAEDPFQEPPKPAQPNKIISRDEGEYVDFEEIKN